MSYLLATGITVGLLVGVQVYLNGAIGLIGFVGSLGRANYFAAGGGLKGVRPTFCINMNGVLWGFVTIAICNLLPGVPGTLFTILFAVVMCWQVKFTTFGFIPGTSVGNAAFYASRSSQRGITVALVCNVFLGVLSNVLIKKMSEKKETIQISRMDHQYKELDQAENMAGGGGMDGRDLSNSNTDADSRDSFTGRMISDTLSYDVIVIDMNEHIVDVNSRYCHYCDQSAQSLIGADVNAVEANVASLIAMLGSIMEARIMSWEMGDLIL